MISMIMKVSLAAFMLAGGIIKVFRVPFQVEHWRHYQYPLWFLTVTGILEIVGAFAMTAGIWNRYAAFGAGVLFVVLMAGAVHAHIVRARQSVLMTIPAIICLIVSISIIIWEST
ncbi:DoxX family protein [Bacillus halotolerans]|uniref:DoxX family protein n=1 Tax=Bacillus halotolerans TaxID=260554 RepID=UPI00192B4BB1|nr:DoxX family protein [Bacillus halotolerans]MBL4963885.1 DoxX family protein [Bacillus halotolerans]MBL4975370.1 DoxX family protein [Bacillus halotolerans]MBT9251592.1 DoxX family protein [Bacillus halotolerans]MDL5612779.1 DoxX family protein [Bacillus halotolerans]MEC1408633.1 DoxX family protein [Bacillus halotolerans]